MQTVLSDVLASQCIILIYGIFEEYFKRTRTHTHIIDFLHPRSFVRLLDVFLILLRVVSKATLLHKAGDKDFSLLFCLESEIPTV